MLSSDWREGVNMGVSGSNCNETWEDEMARDLSRNRAYCAAREAISKQHRGWEKKLAFVGRTEEAWRRARARDARLQDEWVLVEGEAGLDSSVMG